MLGAMTQKFPDHSEQTDRLTKIEVMKQFLTFGGASVLPTENSSFFGIYIMLFELWTMLFEL